MHLKTLTLKGFKSFASATTLRFEPGITCVVGPNGSGKSNVVDAIAWVLGEQGAKALRGGKMEDVIFAGTSGRAPLGRAEVTLTIDNTDAALPIDYTEVSITRRMFRSGESEYAINGDTCRLLDIQELLSDSGIGREMHVIVGQGQLDSVLRARPEDRRGFIEEAAGVLKHRKRKEKALRKLDAMSANFARLTDLIAELRRQLKPLGRQAEVARRAATVQSELRDGRLRLLADDLVTLRRELDAEMADEAAIRDRHAEVERALAVARTRETELDQALAESAPALARAQETWYRLSALDERFRGTASLAAERARHLSAEPDGHRTGRDPEETEAEAARVREREAELDRALEADRARLAEAVAERTDVEARLARAEKEHVAAVRAIADRREGLARLRGQVNTAASRASAASEEIERLTAVLTDARERAERDSERFNELRDEVGALDAGEVGLDKRHETAVAEHEKAEERVRELTDAGRDAERDRSTWQARAEALELGLAGRDGAGELLAAGDRLPGLLGPVAALLTVRPGHEAAIAAALGAIADAVAVSEPGAAEAALGLLKDNDAGRAGLLIAGPSPRAGTDRPPPTGAQWARDLVDAPDGLAPAVDRVLDGVAVVTDLDQARRLVADHPDLRAVTADGDLFGAYWAAGGSAKAPSVIEVRAAADEARTRVAEATERRDRLATELIEATRARDAAKEARRAALAALHESDAAMNAVAEKLAELGAAARSATAEADRTEKSITAAREARDQHLARLDELTERLRLAEATPIDDEPPTTERDELAAAGSAARQTEMEARLAVRTGEERVRSLRGRADALVRAAAAERAARIEAERQREIRARGAAMATRVHQLATTALDRIAESLARAVAERDEIAATRSGREAELATVRSTGRELAAELSKLTDAVHRDEVAQAERRLRVEALETRAADEFAIGVDTLVGEYGPDAPVPPSAQEMAEYEAARGRGESVVAPTPGRYDRRTQEKRVARAERDLKLLGKVNPLALEEFAALEERHKFLSTQLDDLKATRRDLMTVVKEVDERIHEVFSSAYQDTAREFETVFSTLFPGGHGKLVLTEPDNMLTTGIEVEARPPGKKVKRLSLLSGGERSLTAVALLVAIFRARPSPFYVMDEVEAALDDTNLGRLLGLIELLRETSQLIVITHQKRTMEIADSLYGVSMRGDGITTVISQRLRERESA